MMKISMIRISVIGISAIRMLRRLPLMELLLAKNRL